MHLETEQNNITLNRIRDDLPRFLEMADKPAIIVGLLFCPSGSPRVRDHILPSFNDLNANSGVHTHFFLPGWRSVIEDDPHDQAIYRDSNCPPLKYDANLMWKFKRSLRDETSRWKSTNTVELLLLDGTADHLGNGLLNYGSVINVQLGTIMRQLEIQDVNELFSVIFHFAEDFKDLNPTSALSNKFARNQLGKSLLRRLSSVNIANIANVLRDIKPFATHDYRRLIR